MNTSMSNPKTEIILALGVESRTKAEERDKCWRRTEVGKDWSSNLST